MSMFFPAAQVHVPPAAGLYELPPCNNLQAALAVAETVDELFKCSARVMRKCQGWQEEALELKLPRQIVDTANAMVGAVREAGEVC